eukprot:11332625-Alexandrium_andersonii.AAC.1
MVEALGPVLTIAHLGAASPPAHVPLLLLALAESATELLHCARGGLRLDAEMLDHILCPGVV